MTTIFSCSFQTTLSMMSGEVTSQDYRGHVIFPDPDLL